MRAVVDESVVFLCLLFLAASTGDADTKATVRAATNILSGSETDRDFVHLSASDRGAVREIIRATIKGLPDYWK